ncbi:MAG: helix-turn-helix domain-containing protein [Anaerolineales bacterium]|nr:helix-turn-helix domain-containing protein [Chloroflexota bacterium]MBL6982707.1 helix-turn-helix domain-containing protein [Anaerolineales bacterium]
MWITVSEAANLSGYHPEHIRDLVRDGRIKAQKFATIWQVDRKSLFDYIQEMEKKGEKRGPKGKARSE